MKKGDHLFLVQVAEESAKYNAFTRKRAVLDYIKQRKAAACAPSGRIITVQMVGEWEIEQVALLVPKIEEREPKPGFRGNDGRIPCLDIRCLDGGGHFKDECPHKDESTPCEDEHCQVIGPHTIYNCKNVPRKKKTGWKDIDTTPRGCTNPKCAMPLASREEKCMRSSCPNYE